MNEIGSSLAMSVLMDDVRDFHEINGEPPQLELLRDPPDDLVRLRAKLITEEFMETLAAMIDTGETPEELKASIAQVMNDLDSSDVRFNLEAFADGLADLIYVCVGAADRMGIPLDRVWSEVQRANMAKVGGPRRADGKVGKPPGWVGPRIREALGGFDADIGLAVPA